MKNFFRIFILVVFTTNIFAQTTLSPDDGAISCVDKDGNSYRTVTIGNQTWMAENLKTTRFNDSTKIPLMSDIIEWRAALTPAYCWYDKEPQKYKNDLGALYNHYTVETNKLCPKGWHVPTDKEWKILIDYNGGVKGVGSRLKANGFPDMAKIKANSTDKSFNVVPAGSRGMFGLFFGMGMYATYWTATKYDLSAWSWYADGHDDNAYRALNDRKTGLSVRCIKNNNNK